MLCYGGKLTPEFIMTMTPNEVDLYLDEMIRHHKREAEALKGD